MGEDNFRFSVDSSIRGMAFSPASTNAMKSEMKALKSQGWVYGRLTGCSCEAGKCVLLSYNRLKELCVLSEKNTRAQCILKSEEVSYGVCGGCGGVEGV